MLQTYIQSTRIYKQFRLLYEFHLPFFPIFLLALPLQHRGECHLEKEFLHKLLKTIAEGDRKAFRKLFNLYKDQVYAYAMHFTRSQTHSEEIVQEIFLKLWLHKETLAQIDNFEAWLRTITRNLCFDYLKKLAREQALKQKLGTTLNKSDENVEFSLICNQYENLMHQALELLPPQQKRIYTLSFYQGKKQDEIAGSLHISRNTVKVHLSKARAAVRQYLATHIDPYCILILFLFLFFSVAD